MSSRYNPQHAQRQEATGPANHDANPTSCVLATFRFVCESRDGRLCLFEDAQGHYTVVRTARLA